MLQPQTICLIDMIVVLAVPYGLNLDKFWFHYPIYSTRHNTFNCRDWFNYLSFLVENKLRHYYLQLMVPW